MRLCGRFKCNKGRLISRAIFIKESNNDLVTVDSVICSITGCIPLKYIFKFFAGKLFIV